jgi:hypothetical protein
MTECLAMLRATNDAKVPGAWLKKASRFQVMVQVISPSTSVRNFLENARIKDVNGGRAILLVESLQTVSDLVNNGIEIDNVWYGVVAKCAPPKISCPGCGSLSHKSCEFLSAFGVVLLENS